MDKNRTFCQLDTDCIDWIAEGCLARMWKTKTRLDYGRIAATFPIGRAVAGLYCIWESKGGLARPLYVGESHNLRERIRQLRFLSQHTFARQYAILRARKNRLVRPTKEVVSRLSRKRKDEIEAGLEDRYLRQLRLGWVATSFGRTEIEEALIRRYDPPFNGL